MPLHNKNRRLAVETLETRNLLAGIGPTITTYTTRVEIEGTDKNDTADVYYHQGDLVISVGLKFQRRNHVTIPAKEAAKINLIKFNGGRGNDFFHNHTSIKSTARGGWGFDKLIGGHNADKLYGGQGHDVIMGGLGDDTIHGDDINHTRTTKYDGNDILRGGPGIDSIYGQGGHDDLFGGEDDDYLNGGPGVDILRGEQGNDRIHGRGDSDLLVGGSGEDTLDGGTHDDVIYGGRDKDKLFGNAGHDCLFGGRESDTIKGGPGDDYLSTGLGGRDIADGESGNDVVYGFAKHDVLKGETIVEGTGELVPKNESCHPDEFGRTFSHPNGKYRYIKPESPLPTKPPVDKQAEDIKVDEPIYQIVIIDEVDPGSKNLPKGTSPSKENTRAVVGPADFRLGETTTPPDEGEDREAKRIRLNEQRSRVQEDLGVLKRDQTQIRNDLEFLELYPEAIEEFAFQLDLTGDEIIPYLTGKLDATESKIETLENTLAKINLVLNALFGPEEFDAEESETEDSSDSLPDAPPGPPLYKISFDENYIPQFGHAWTTHEPLATGADLRHILSTGTTRIELLNDKPAQNPVMAFDTNLDNYITPLDALRVINHLNQSNRKVAGDVHTYLDTSGDGTVTPLDALLIINHLNSHSPSGEGPDPGLLKHWYGGISSLRNFSATPALAASRETLHQTPAGLPRMAWT